MFFDTSLVPHTSAGRPSIRNLGASSTDVGDGRYNFSAYIRERGDTAIQSLADLIAKQNYWDRPGDPAAESLRR